MSDKACLITGVGPGTGTALVKRFCAEGFAVAMMARNVDRLTELAESVEGAYAYPCDVTDQEAVISAISAIERDLGAPEVLIHNAVGGAFGTFMEIDPAVLQRNFDVNTMALLHLARRLAPAMIAAGKGSILCTGNTSAYRGKAGFAGFAPTKAAQRILAESMARDLGPKGIHVAYVAIDAVIDLPWTRKRNPDTPDDFFCKPDDIAAECFRITQQPKSAWSFNIEVRPFGEVW